MKIHTVDPRSPEWHALRLGIVTASDANRLITPTGKASSQCEGYCHALLGEWLSGAPDEFFESQAMARGIYLEDEAVAYYELQTDTTTDPGGFVTTDDGRVGCSPDRLVYTTGEHERPIGGLEIKCPSQEKHIGYMLSGSHADKVYRHQVQCSLWVTGLAWWDVMSYHPLLPPALVRVEPDADWQRAWEPILESFLADLEAGKRELRGMGHLPANERQLRVDTAAEG